MNNKKIVLSILLIISINILLTGCSEEKESNTIKVAIDLKYEPFMYMDKKIDEGLEPDLARAFGEYLGKEVEIVNTDFSMLIASADSGETDIIISDMSVNEQRKEKLDFSEGYRYGRTITLVNKEFYEINNINDDMSVEEFFSLDGIKCIGLSGTIGTSIPEEYGVEAIEAMEIGTAIAEITSGNSNVLIGSNTVIGDHAANKDTTEMYFGIPEYSTSSFAVKKGNEDLLILANKFIESLYEENGLYSELEVKYDAVVGEFLKDESLGLRYIVSKPE